MRYTSAKSRPTFTFDAELELKDAGLVAADAAATVDSAARVINLGTGYTRGTVVVDVTAIETDSSNERYDIILQLSSSSTFASTIVDRAVLSLGHATALPGDQTNSTGRYTLHFDNEFGDGTTYQYARLYTDVTGTVSTGINYSAFIGELHQGGR